MADFWSGLVIGLLLALLPIVVFLSLLLAYPWLWGVILGLVLFGLGYLATHAEDLARKLGPKEGRQR